MGESRDKGGDRRGVPFLNGDVWRVHISYRNIFGRRVGWVIGEFDDQDDAAKVAIGYILSGADDKKVMTAYCDHHQMTEPYNEDEDEVF